MPSVANPTSNSVTSVTEENLTKMDTANLLAKASGDPNATKVTKAKVKHKKKRGLLNVEVLNNEMIHLDF